MLNGANGEGGVLDIYREDVVPQLSEADARGARIRRENDLQDLSNLAPQFRDAFDAANPEQAALLKALNQSALSQVEAGAGLDADLQRQVSQSARGGQAARGFGFGLNDSAQEALFSGMAGEQLRRSRMGSAAQVAGLNAASAVDPALAVLGRQGVNLGQAGMVAGQAGALNPGSLFDPQNGYAADIFSSNHNAAAAANIATANNRAGLWSGALQATGSIAGGMMCWVAREVYGENNPQWMDFRQWVLEEAPRWFRRGYIKHGEKIARWIAPRPWAKVLVRAWMDSRIGVEKEDVPGFGEGALAGR